MCPGWCEPTGCGGYIRLREEISREEFVTGLGQHIADRPALDTAVHTAGLSLVQVADRDRNGVLDSAECADLAAVYGAGPRRPRPPSTGSTWTATACWTPPS